MKYKDIIKSVKCKGKTSINLEKIYPIKPIDLEEVKITYLIDDEEQSLFFESFYANKIIITTKKEVVIDICLGKGYLTEKADNWTNLFITDDLWQGGDGIFSFNIETGEDKFDQENIAKTLFVFGDTFVGNYDRLTEKRYMPQLMPNNTLAYLENNKVDFRINRGELGQVLAYYNMKEEDKYQGYLPKNLVSYNCLAPVKPYLSSYYPKSLEITFDLSTKRKITHIEIENYFDEDSPELSKRGLKEITLFGSNDNTNWEKIDEFKLRKANKDNLVQALKINKTYRHFKILVNPINGLGNYNDQSFQEGLFGFNKIRFYNEKDYYKDILANANSILIKEAEHAWIWLQDGVVIGNNLYFLPLNIASDHTQVEGMQFKVLGVSMFKTPIINQEIVPEKSIQKKAPVFAKDKTSTYFYGAGIFANTIQAKALNPDGYIYIYGYKTTNFLRELIVSRVKEDRFEYFDDWEYFDGVGYSKNILDSKPLLPHVSCEMSVSEILEGRFKGKYIAVFTYDVNTKYVSFAISDSLTGPFSKPQKIYITPEQSIFKSTTYTYNAKAHPNMSKSKRILVSYNTNTYNFDHNMSNRLIYGPRFIYLNEIE